MIERIKDRVCLTSVSLVLDVAVVILGRIRKNDTLQTSVEVEDNPSWADAETPQTLPC